MTILHSRPHIDIDPPEKAIQTWYFEERIGVPSHESRLDDSEDYTSHGAIYAH